MRSIVVLCLAAALASCRSGQPGTPAPRVAASAVDIVAAADRMAALDLWPGFDPRTVPVAIFDGRSTWLFRHPSPPAGFEPDLAHPAVLVFPGRHPDVTANTSAPIGGVPTAVLTLDPRRRYSVTAMGAVLVHESFHVFEHQRHPGWTANEVELFTYPDDDVEALSLRRGETEALRRALAIAGAATSACWARQALAERAARYARLPQGSVAYERGIELLEGLSEYVEYRARNAPMLAVIPAADYPPDVVRQRGYRAGLALARLLDRFSPDWRASLERHDSTTLDGMLGVALSQRADTAARCGFSAGTPAAARDRALRDVAALREARAARRRAFLSQRGWRIVVDATASPLYPQGFDPLNVRKLTDGEILHTRWLRLGRPGSTIEVMGRASLTESAGTHPLFEGVRTLTVTGLPAEPSISAVEGGVTVEADGVRGQFANAEVEPRQRERILRVRLR